MSEPKRVETKDLKKISEVQSCSSSNNNLKSEIRRHLFSDIGNKSHHESDTGQNEHKKKINSSAVSSREIEFGEFSGNDLSETVQAEMVDGEAAEDNQEIESTIDDGGHDRSSEASEDNDINEHLGTGINLCSAYRIACSCAECMIQARLNQIDHGPDYNCARNCRICRYIQKTDYEEHFFDLGLNIRHFPMETLENNNEDGPIIEYKDYQLDIILSFLSAIIGIRTSAFKSQVIAVDLIPEDDLHNLVVYFRTENYPAKFFAIWEYLSGENPDENIQLLRNSGTLVEYFNQRDDTIGHGPSESSDSSSESDNGISIYEPDEVSEIADNLDYELNVTDGYESDEEENYSGVIETGTEDDGIMNGGFEAKKEEPKKELNKEETNEEESKEEGMEIEFLGEKNPNEAGTSNGTGSTAKRQGPPMVSSFSSGHKRKSEPLFPMVEENDDDIVVIQEIKKPKTSM